MASSNYHKSILNLPIVITYSFQLSSKFHKGVEGEKWLLELLVFRKLQLQSWTQFEHCVPSELRRADAKE